MNNESQSAVVQCATCDTPGRVVFNEAGNITAAFFACKCPRPDWTTDMENASIPALDVQKYVRKPLYVDAVKVTEENFSDVVRWCFGEVCNIDESKVDPAADLQPAKQFIHVRVHNPKNPRQTRAFVGDWILYTERGYKVYTEKAFQANFDQVDSEAAVSS